MVGGGGTTRSANEGKKLRAVRSFMNRLSAFEKHSSKVNFLVR